MATILNFSITDNEEQLKSEGWTDGELLLGKRLKNTSYLRDFGQLVDREIQTVWAQVHLRGGDKRVDFLAFTNNCIFVIEVKDFSDPANSKAKPWETSVRNAYVQCSEYISEIQRVCNNGMPVIGIVAYPNIQGDDSLAHEIQVQGRKKYGIDTWFSHEVQNKHLQTLFERSIDLHNVKPISSPTKMVCAMAKLVPDLISVEDYSCNDELPLHIFDRDQINISHDFTRSGDRIIYGVAGSGKTVIIINRAKQLARIHPEFNILVISYNKPLNLHLENQTRGTNIDVQTIHAWYRSILQRWDPSLHDQILDDNTTKNNNVKSSYFERLPQIVDEKIKEGNSLPSYDAILIDEGQDFKKTWFKHLRMAYSASISSLFLVCLDSLQAIHHREDGFTWSSVGIAARGRTMYLRRNYRNRSKIGEYAISKLENIPENKRDEDMRQYLEIEDLPRKGGAVIAKDLDFSNTFKYISEVIKNLDVDEICMIIYDKIKAPYRLKGLRKYGIENRKIWGPRETKEQNVMPNRLTVPMYSVYRSKGLEADVVIFIHPTEMKDQQINYVAITRAREKIIDITITSYD